MIDEIVDYPTENRYQLRRLIQSIEASYGELNLLICICDNPYYRDEIIHDYEAELSAKGINCDRVQIDRDRPSLKQSLLDRQPNSNPQRSEIVTVMGIDGLLNVNRERDFASATTVNRSAQEQFFFSTQWTREALREFRFPVILWMTESIAGELSRQAPDFWSWRGGVFEFVRPMTAVNGEFDRTDLTIDLDDFEVSKSSANPEAIQAQIDKILATDPNSPLLRSLYLSLGIAYRDRYRKNVTTKHTDIENAISTFHRGLELTSREAFPEEWATIEINLAIAFGDRVRGRRADNFEESIRCYHLALEVLTREAFPEQWARIEVGLANLEESIRCYNLALAIRTQDAFPDKWAGIQLGLGNAYQNRVWGEQATNLERAIEHYRFALIVYTRDMYPEQWAMTQTNLATAYQNRLQGDRVTNLEQAIEYYQLALEVRSKEDYPEQWATTQINLATAYSKRIRGDKAENLEQAIEYYQLVLGVYTYENSPEEWAMTQHNLAVTYGERIKGEKVHNLEHAIECFHLALNIFTPEAYPENWGRTKASLAVAFHQRLTGDRITNLEQAIECYQSALSIFIYEAYPQKWIQIQMNLVQAQKELVQKQRQF
jgi:tetratricopeptide (TPR) repeat protein